MFAGQMRERVTFERRLAANDGAGNTEGEFSAQFTCWARIEPRLGGEEITAARLAGRQPVTITIWWCRAAAEVTPDWRARNARSGVFYNIKSVANTDEQRRQLEILAEQGAPDGE